ncbi:hypothetical protein [Croceiramulus getboli]|nr:hypothetical protein P8624_01215 [Flavobacteriaceae bacterium YJPT1-3]
MERIKRGILFLFLLALTGILGAQERVLFQGRVLNDTVDKSGLNVVNLQLGKGTTTGTDGVFRIPVRVGDTLMISSVEYERETIPITRSLYDRGQLDFYLVPKVNELATVTVRDSPLTGNLEDDFGVAPLTQPIVGSDLGLPGRVAEYRPPEVRRYQMQFGGGGVPLEYILNAISGRLKEMKKQMAIAQLEREVEANRKLFEDSIYTRTLKIPQELIADFAFFAYEEDEHTRALARQQELLELLDALMNKATAYRKRRGLE